MNIEEIRKRLLDALNIFRKIIQKGVVEDFNIDTCTDKNACIITCTTIIVKLTYS